jgi:hypothetical protein
LDRKVFLLFLALGALIEHSNIFKTVGARMGSNVVEGRKRGGNNEGNINQGGVSESEEKRKN